MWQISQNTTFARLAVCFTQTCYAPSSFHSLKQTKRGLPSLEKCIRALRLGGGTLQPSVEAECLGDVTQNTNASEYLT